MKTAPVPSFWLLRAGAAMQINMHGLIVAHGCLQSHMFCVMLLPWGAAFCCRLEALDVNSSKGYNVY